MRRHRHEAGAEGLAPPPGSYPVLPRAGKTQAQRDIYFPEVSLTNLVNGSDSSFQGCAWPPHHQLRRVTCDLVTPGTGTLVSGLL